MEVMRGFVICDTELEREMRDMSGRMHEYHQIESVLRAYLFTIDFDTDAMM